jgi:hypothetical protein
MTSPAMFGAADNMNAEPFRLRDSDSFPANPWRHELVSMNFTATGQEPLARVDLVI